MFRCFPESSLFDQNTFHRAFERDLQHAKQEVIIESPFITASRMKILLPIFHKLSKRGVRIIVNTRPPEEHEGDYCRQAVEAVAALQDIGAIVLLTGGHHRKLVIIDRKVFYEGSLNILSYRDSCEIMRRVVSSMEAKRLLRFIGLTKYVRPI
jgi:phosphatidylserine/phosphatidylglycerophosphate/cardiolipin synthase-like enzyme